MLITVAICTYNRAESLRRTLHSLAAMRVPGGLAWELLVVNNNGTDHTDRVIDEYRDRLPIRHEFELQPGLSNARNRAVDLSNGNYIVWTDDDVVVDPGWLQEYADAFRRWPDAAVFGGRITPRYEAPVAQWVKECEAVLGGPFAIRNLGEDTLPLSVEENRLPFGANFAIRTVEQRKFRYNPDLGVSPNRRRMDEETDSIVRILELGAIGYWLPDAAVQHWIGRERQSIRYMRDWCEAWGETQAFRAVTATVPPPHFINSCQWMGLRSFRVGAAATTEPLWIGVPRGLWPRIIYRWLRYCYHRLISPPSVWVTRLQRFSCTRGAFRYWWHRSS